MSKSKELDDLIGDLAGLIQKQVGDETTGKMPVKEQIEMMREFIAKPMDFKVGDLLKRNRFGKLKYKFPKGDGYGMVVSLTEPSEKDEEKHPVHGFMVVVMEDSKSRQNLHMYSVDFRYYDRVDEKDIT